MSTRSVLVALDASNHSRAVVETGAALASALDAELQGLFVEDVNLLRLAGLPFARELMWSSAAECALDARRMERMLRVWAASARAALMEEAARRQVTGIFRVVRGRVAGEILTAAHATDLVVLGTGSSGRLGSTACALATQAMGPVLLLRAGGAVRSPAVLVLEQGDDVRTVLRRTLPLLTSMGMSELTVLVSGTDVPSIPASTGTNPQGIRVVVRVLAVDDASHAQRVVLGFGAGLLVLPGSSSLAQETGLRGLAAELDCAILVVR